MASNRKKNQVRLISQPVSFNAVLRKILKNALLLIMLVVACPSCRYGSRAGETAHIVGNPAPAFSESVKWLNTDYPLTMDELRGRVTLIYFWTYGSIHAHRAIPYVNRWRARYGEFGFTVIGVHVPQFEFEKNIENVTRETGRAMIVHPVILDNDYLVWSSYKNRAWPTFYLIDAAGIVRQAVVGEGKYAEIEEGIRKLLNEAGYLAPEVISADEEEAVDFSKLGTPEIHTGFDELSHFGSPEPVLPNRIQTYGSSSRLELNHFYLVGEWEIEKERSVLRGRAGKVLIRYQASRVYLVLSSLHATRFRAEVRLDGEPLSADTYGQDIWFRDGKSYVEIDHPRVYTLVDTRGEYGEHVLEVSFIEPSVEIYSFMFG